VPSLGSLYANPNGQIPRNFYAGDPNWNTNDRTQYSAGYLFEHSFNDVFTFRQNLRYLDTTGDVNQLFPNGLEADNATLDRYVQTDRERIGAFTLDNQLQGKFATGWLQHTTLLGLDYQNTLFDQNIAQGAGPTFTGPSINIYNPVYYQPITLPSDNDGMSLFTNSSQKSTQTGLYGQDQMRLGNFILVVGGRHDWADADTFTYNDPALFGTPATSTTTPQHDQANTGRVGGVYLFDNGIAPYAVASTSFNPNIGTEFGGQPFKPTTGRLYETGVRYQPIGFNAMITASVYDIVEQNVLTPDPSNVGFNVQTGAIRSRGFEFEGKASITKQLNVLASYSYTDARVTQSNDVDLGRVPLGVPQNQAAGWFDYTFRYGLLDGFGFGAGVRYVGSSFGDKMNTEIIPAYTLMDGMLRYDFSHLGSRWKGYELQVNATNLFNTGYISECTDANCVYGLSRTVLATLRYRW
jgi:iron complex outermembrane recepter protein